MLNNDTNTCPSDRSRQSFSKQRFPKYGLPRLRYALVATVMLFTAKFCFAMQNESADGVVNSVAESKTRSAVNESLDSTPWYDAEKGQIVPIDLKPRQDDSIHRDSRWLPKPKQISKSSNSSTTNNNNTGTTGQGTGLFGTSFSLGNLFGWVLLFAIVLAIIGSIVYAVSRAELSTAGRKGVDSINSKSKGLPDEQMLERIKHLPPELRRTDVNLRTECERLMNEGKFEQAIILLLGHQLLLLDRNGLLRLSRGKTNGRYVRETRSADPSCAVWLRATADAFEQSYFGRHEIPAQVFVELWQQNSLLENAAHTFGGAK